VALLDDLRRLGFAEGQNLAVDWSGYGLSAEQFEQHAVKLVNAGVDLITAGGDAAVRAAQRATTSIPILALTDDMVGQGFVRSLANPGGNTTGVTLLASELDGKRQEILIEAVPGVRRIAALADTHTTTPSRLTELEDAARARGVTLSIHRVARMPSMRQGGTVYGRNRKRDEAAGVAGRWLRSNSGRCGLNHGWSASSERSHGGGGPKHGGVICRG
jgi:putative ABC transport system substrate-binding protein